MPLTLDMINISDDVTNIVKYWQSLPVDEAWKIPNRKDFNPFDVASSLPIMFVSQWISEEDIQIRLAGTQTVEWLKADLTGQMLFEVLPEAIRETERNFYKSMRDTPCGGTITRHASLNSNEYLVYETIYLPMWNNQLGYMEFIGAAHASSRKFQSASHKEKVRFDHTDSIERHFVDIGNGVPK